MGLEKLVEVAENTKIEKNNFKDIKPQAGMTLEKAKDFVKTFSKKGFTYPLTKYELSRIIIKYDLPNSLNAPVLKDEIIGNVEIYLDNCLLFSEKIYTMDNVKKVGVWSSIQDLLSDW